MNEPTANPPVSDSHAPDERPAPQAKAPPQVPMRVSLPPEPTDKARMWLFLLLSLLACSAPLLVELGRPAVGGPLEHISMVTSRETWRAMHAGEEDAWITPTWNGRLRLNKPPMLVWMNLLAWSDLKPPPPGDRAALHEMTDTMVLRARLVGFGMALMALVGTYWAAYCIGGVRAAAMATLVTGTTLLFIKQGRVANYDTHLMGWVTLSIAAGIWAIRPLKPINWVGRRVLGWAIAGVALGAAMMTKNPSAIIYVAVPLALVIAVAPRRRLGNALGLLFTLILAGLIATPWHLHIMEFVPDAKEQFAKEYAAHREHGQPFYYYITILFLVFPWSVYLVGSLFQPFLRARGEHRRRVLLGWLWFVSLVVILSCHPTKQYRYLAPLLPAIGVLVGQLWAYHAALAKEGLKDPGVNLLRFPHWLMLGVGAIGLPLFIGFQDQIANDVNRWFASEGQVILRPDELPGLPWWAGVALGVVLVTATIFGAVWHWRWRPARAFIASVVWVVVTTTVVHYSSAYSFHSVYEPRVDAERVAAAIAGQPLYYLYDPQQDVDERKQPGNFEPEEEFLFYMDAQVRPAEVEQLPALATQPCYIMLRLDDKNTNAGRLEGYGFVYTDVQFTDGRHIRGFDRSVARLYRSPAVK